MSTTFCLDCDRVLDIGHNPEVGQRVNCPSCDTTFEVIHTNPLKLDWIYDGPTINLDFFERPPEHSNWPTWR